MKLILFSAPECAGCKVVKSLLAQNSKEYQEFDTSTTTGLTELRCTIPGTYQLPVLVIRDQGGDVIFKAKDMLDRFDIRRGPWLQALGISDVSGKC